MFIWQANRLLELRPHQSQEAELEREVSCKDGRAIPLGSASLLDYLWGEIVRISWIASVSTLKVLDCS